MAADVVHERGIGVEGHEPGVARIGQHVGGEERVLDPILEGDVEQGEAHGQARQGLRLEIHPDRPAVGALLAQRRRCFPTRPAPRVCPVGERGSARTSGTTTLWLSSSSVSGGACSARDQVLRRTTLANGCPAQAELRRRSVAECAVVLVARGGRQLELLQAGQRVVFPEHRDDDFRESAGGPPVQVNAELRERGARAVCRKCRAARAGPPLRASLSGSTGEPRDRPIGCQVRRLQLRVHPVTVAARRGSRASRGWCATRPRKD